MARTYRLKGINDDETTCCACGKAGLKKVIWLAELDEDGNEGETRHYGCDCAGLLLRGEKTRTNTTIATEQAKIVDHARRLLARGYTVADVEGAIGRRYGYSVNSTDQAVLIYFDRIPTPVSI